MDQEVPLFKDFIRKVDAEAKEVPATEVVITAPMLPVGKTQPIKPNQLPAEIVAILTARIHDEYKAHYMYRNASNWCRDKNYSKAASYFEKEAAYELDHAKMLQDYIVDFNVVAVIPPAETLADYSSLIDIVNKAYEFEYYLMKAYNENSLTVFTKDLVTFDFLEKFREIQKESVVEYSDLLNAAALVDANDGFQILYFEQTYF